MEGLYKAIGNGLVSLLLIFGGCSGKSKENTRRLEHLKLVKTGITTIDDYFKAEHPYDLTGDDIKDTFSVNPDGSFILWPGKGPASEYRKEPLHGYGQGEVIGNVGQISQPHEVPRARTNKTGSIEVLVAYQTPDKEWAEVWEVQDIKKLQ